MSYIRPMGDGPVLHPGEDDPPVVPPTRVDCKSLPSDSPWRRPGELCADAPISTIFDPVIDIVMDAIDGKSPDGSPAAPEGGITTSNLVLLGALGVGAYYLLRKRKRS